MQELLELILKNIVTNPDAVQVAASEEEGREVYTITVDPGDMGRVIGKSGKVIKAIRALAHVVAIRQGKRFRINLADEGGDTQVVEEVSASPAEVEEVADVIDLSAEAVEEAEAPKAVEANEPVEEAEAPEAVEEVETAEATK
jgi:uncharacterized protein